MKNKKIIADKILENIKKLEEEMNNKPMFLGCNITKLLIEKINDFRSMAIEDMTQENLEGFDYAANIILSLLKSLVNCAEISHEILVHTSKLNPEHEVEEFNLHDLLRHFDCKIIKESNKLTDREKLEKVLEFVQEMEDKHFEPFTSHKYESEHTGVMINMHKALAYQRVRYLVEDLLEEGE